MSLSDKVNAQRDAVIDACCELVEAEVAKKGGLSGAVLKTGYRAVKGVKPGFIRKVVDKLLDEWVAKLNPLYDQAKSSGQSLRRHFEQNRSAVANALLSVTDEKSDNAESALVRSTYQKLRPKAQVHVEEAVPGLAAVLEKYAA